MSIKIMADSASDLTKDYFSKYDMEMVSLTVHLDEKDYEDGINITPKNVFDAMRKGKSPKTSQVSPHTFKDIFTEYAKSKQTLIYLAFSSELSGTYQTAKMMEAEVKEEYPDADIHVIDT